MGRKLEIVLVVGLLAGPAQGELLQVGFEDLGLDAGWVESYGGPGDGVYYNGSNLSGGFSSEGVFFGNEYTDWGGGYYSWSGWAYSTTTDTGTAGFDNQYSAFAGGAAGGRVYAVTYAPSTLDLPLGWRAPQELSVTNNSYAGISMRDGDAFAKQFGAGDYFLLTLTGYDAGGLETGSVEVYLADFRDGLETGYILDSWATVDLSPLGSGVAQITFSLESTDTGDFGSNTPSYVAIDNLVLESTPVPEPRTWSLALGLCGFAFALFRRWKA